MNILDISLDKNREAVDALLEVGASVLYVDHHYPGEYLACMQSYVHQKIGAHKFAVEALRVLQDDWLSIHSAIVDSIETNKNWVRQLSQQSGAQIVAMLDYRKQAAPGIEYQASLLEFTMERPANLGSLESSNDEILFLAA